jgi:TolB-like protein/Tfp pilus assembly protein PilF
LSLFTKLKRRNVFRAGIAYIITAWLIAQVAGLAAQSFEAPAWVMKMIITLLLLGFPLAMFFTWAYDLTPDGLSRESDQQAGEPVANAAARKLDRAIILVLVLALAWFSWDKFFTAHQGDQSGPGAAVRDAAEEPGAGDPAVAAESAPRHSIAVLPFVNMSEEPGNEYFADGLSEELLNMLVKIPELRVAARTSSFSFNGKDAQISDIARQLNVNHVLEGSVRKSGNRVRITTQLIKADDGFHLWSENYDRTLDDIFAVQDEIASRVAGALQITLLGHPPRARQVNPDAYAFYLKGSYFLYQRGRENLEKAVHSLLQAIELEPGYAEAWEMLATTYYLQTSQGFLTREKGTALAKEAIERAINLDPERGVTWGAYGHLKKNFDWDWEAARTALARAHQLDPNQSIILTWRASLAQTLGRLDEAIEIYQQALTLDPLNTSNYSSLGILYRKIRRPDDAIAIFRKQIALRPEYHWAYFNLGKTYVFEGDAKQALVEIEKNPPNVFRETGLVMAYSALGREAEARAALDSLVSRFGEQNAQFVAEAYTWLGEKDQAFKWLEKAYSQKEIGLVYILNNRIFERLVDDPRWTEFLRKMNLLEHWRAMPPEHGGPQG